MLVLTCNGDNQEGLLPNQNYMDVRPSLPRALPGRGGGIKLLVSHSYPFTRRNRRLKTPDSFVRRPVCLWSVLRTYQL
jgi:hypothetical protein